MEHFIQVHNQLYHLLKDILYIILVISGFGALIIPIFFADKMIKPQRNHVSNLSLQKRISNLDRAGRWFVCCAIISIVLGLSLSKLDNMESGYEQREHFDIIEKENKKQYEESVKDMHHRDELAKKDKTADELKNQLRDKTFKDSIAQTNSLMRENKLQNENLKLQLEAEHKENIDLQNEVNSPDLRIEYDTSNPKLYYDSKQNFLCFTVFVTNHGKGVADSIRRHFTLVGIGRFNQLVILNSADGNYSYNWDKMDGNPDLNLQYTHRMKDTALVRSLGKLYLAIEVTYINAFHKSRPPLQKIYNYNLDNLNKPLTLLMDDEYNNVKKFLIVQKEWRKQ